MAEFRPIVSALRAASGGVSLAEEMAEKLRHGESARVDLAAVEIMTPSFANALVMTLLDHVSLADLRDRCSFVNRSDAVVDAMNRAVQRYQNGIRLTTQRPALSA